MAKFSVKISLDDGTIIDDVSAEFPDTIIPYMIAACEKMGHLNEKEEPIIGGRAVTYSLRWFLTDLVKDYANREAAAYAQKQAAGEMKKLLDAIVIKEQE